MKKIVFIAVIFLAATSCIHVDNIFPSGSVTTEERHVKEFNKVSVSGGIQLIAYNGVQEVLVETNENIHEHIDIYVKNNCLIIKPANHISFKGSARIKVYVTAELIYSIEASGGSKVVIPETLISDILSLDGSGGSRFEGVIQARKLDIDLSGGGKADLYIDCATLDAESSGGGVFNFEGIADRVELEITGGGTLNGYYLEIGELYAELSGGAKADVMVFDYIGADLSGGSRIRYKGNPVVSAQTSGGSKISQVN